MNQLPMVLPFLFLAGCVVPPRAVPIPQARTPKQPQPAFFAPLAPHEWFIPWQYPEGVSNRCWTLQTSTNLADWTDVPSDCLTGSVDAYATNPARFYRLKGSL